MKKLEYLEIGKDEFWKLPRYDSALPKNPRKGKCWRKKVPSGWLVGQYVRKARKSPLIIEWYAADMSGEMARILNKSW